MKIKVEVMVPDVADCDTCDRWDFVGRIGDEKAYCNLFKYWVTDDKPCQPCLDARKEASDGA